MKEEAKIKNIYIELCEASMNKDIKKLNNLLADDYILVHMTGFEQTKDDYIKSVQTKELEYFDVIHESIDVNLNGNIANVVGKTKTLASPFGAGKSWWNLKQDLIMEKIEDRWIIKHSKASTY